MNFNLEKSIDKSDTAIECTIVVPFFNQEKILIRNLNAIIQNLSLSSEIIIINDASTDSSHDEVLKFMEKQSRLNDSSLGCIKYFVNQKAQFETKCDDFGIRMAASDFVIEVQADMQLMEMGFDRKLKSALYSNNTLLAISGRGTEPLTPVIEYYQKGLGTDRSSGRTIFRHTASRARYQLRNRLVSFLAKRRREEDKSAALRVESGIYSEDDLKNFLVLGEAGRLGNRIEWALDEKILSERYIYVGQTIMRGPLAIQKSKYLELGGFKTDAFFQAFDDHDFVLRGFFERQYRVGFVPINFSSPISDGSARKVKSLLAEFEILKNIIRIRNERKKSLIYLLDKKASVFPKNEIWNF